MSMSHFTNPKKASSSSIIILTTFILISAVAARGYSKNYVIDNPNHNSHSEVHANASSYSHSHTIDACADIDRYIEWSASSNINCDDQLPVDELDLDGLELNYTDAHGFFYIKNDGGIISALYIDGPYIFVTLTYFSTVDLLVMNVLPHEDREADIVQSVGPGWTTRTLQVQTPGSLVLFNLELRTEAGVDFFLLDKVVVTFEDPDVPTTTGASASTVVSSTPREASTSSEVHTSTITEIIKTTEQFSSTSISMSSTMLITDSDVSSTSMSMSSTMLITDSDVSSTSMSMSSTMPTTDSDVTQSTTLTTTTTTVDPTCPECYAVDGYRIIWQACVGSYDIQRCPGDSNGLASWYCEARGKFNGSNPDYSNCTSKWLAGIEEIISDGNPINSKVAAELVQAILQNVLSAQDPTSELTYFGHEIKSMLVLGQQVLVLIDDSVGISFAEILTSEMFGIFREILKFPDPWEQLSALEASESGTRLITSCDRSAIHLAVRYQTFNESTSYRITLSGFNEFVSLSGMESVTSGNQISYPESYDPSEDSYIEIHSDLANYFPQEFISFAGFELVPEYVNKLFPVSMNSGQRIVNGKLMSLTIDESGAKVVFKENGVRISFRHDIYAWGSEPSQIRRKLHDGERAKAAVGSASCVYWDPVALRWSSDGCVLVSSGRDRTICECDHLTSFAVIMDMHSYIGKDLGLEILTFILCPLSIVCLIICIIVFGYNQRRNQVFSNHPRDDLVLNLCLALLVANVLLLVTTDKNYLNLSDTMCIASAIALHYVFLVAFSWMALEGILLSKLVFLDIFGTGIEHRNIERAAAYLVPALIVGVTCGINFGRGDHGYGNDAYCWLDGGYLWSFVGPVAVVCTFNTVVLALCIRKSNTLQNSSKVQVRRRSRTTLYGGFWVRGSLSLTVIMGLTWIFGFLMLINYSAMANVAAYIFTVFNASQGILIFIFHVALNQKIRQHFTKRETMLTGPGLAPSSGDSRGPTIPSSQ